MSRRIGERPLTNKERSERFRQRQKELAETLALALDVLNECRWYVNEEEGPMARLAVHRAKEVLRKAGRLPEVEEEDGDE